MNVLSVQAMSSGIYQCINNDEKPVFRRPSKSQPHWVEIHSKGELSFSFTFDPLFVCLNLLLSLIFHIGFEMNLMFCPYLPKVVLALPKLKLLPLLKVS